MQQRCSHARTANESVQSIRTRKSKLLERTDPSLLDRLLYADIKTYLHELLMKQDQMSMATSIESRVPFLGPQARRVHRELPER